MANRNQWNDIPRTEPYVKPVNGIVQPPVIPPPNRPGRRTNLLDNLKKVLKGLMHKHCANFFRYPVDAIGLGVPHYHTVIRRPMDLRTIRKRIDNNYYCQAAEAIEDFNLIIKNYQTFNQQGTLIHRDGVEMKMRFDKHLAQMDLSKEWEVNPSAGRRDLSQSKPAATVSNKVAVAEEAKPKANPKSQSGHKGLALEPSHEVCMEMDTKAKAQRDKPKEGPPSGNRKLPKPDFSSLMPAASVPYERKLEMEEEKAKPKAHPKSGKSSSGQAAGRHQSRHELFGSGVLSSQETPFGFVPYEREMEMEEEKKAKREKRKRENPSRSKEDPARSIRRRHGVTSESVLPSLNLAASSPSEMEMEVEKKAKQFKHMTGSKDRDPSGHPKPYLPIQIPAASVPYGRKLEMEERAKPKANPKLGMFPLGREDLALHLHQFQTKSELPSLDLAAFSPNEMGMELEQKAKRVKQKASKEKDPLGYKPNLPSLNLAAFSPNEMEMAEKARPNEIEAKAKRFKHKKHKLPRLNLAAFWPNEMEVKERTKLKANPKPWMSPSGREDRSFREGSLSQTKSEFPRLNLAAFSPSEMEMEENAKRVKPKKHELPSLNLAAFSPNEMEMEVKKTKRVKHKKHKLPRLNLAAFWPNEMEVKERTKLKANPKPWMSPSGREDLSSRGGSLSQTKSELPRLNLAAFSRISLPEEDLCPKKHELPSLNLAALSPSKMEMEVEQKAKRVKNKASKEKLPSGYKDHPEPFLPSLNLAAFSPNEMEMEVEKEAKHKHKPKQPEPSNPPSVREDLARPNPLCLQKADRYIERSNCRKLLKSVRNRKYYAFTWIFNDASYWKYYSKNKHFNYKASKIDWPTLYDYVKSSRFKGFNHVVYHLIQQMFRNGLRCFAEPSEIRNCIKRTISLFHRKLVKSKRSVVEEKSLARALWALQIWKQKVAARKARESGMSEGARESPDPQDLQSEKDSSSEEEDLEDL